jgi:predicted anti-sigma-YlaC factor YlaD
LNSGTTALSRVGKISTLKGLVLLLAFTAGVGGCSIKKIAVNKLGDSLASGGTTFASDDDPDLVGEALPFSLKLMESLLAESPRHRGLLLAASSGFTQYAFVYVQVPAEEAEGQDLAKADYLRMRARHLYIRARNYGLRDLEITHRDFERDLRQDAKAAVLKTGSKDVPLLYWTAVSWGAAISVSKDDPEMISDQPIVEALIDRALELDPDYDSGAIHNFLITYESVRRTASGDFAPRSRKHFERAVELTSGQSAAPYVALATTVSVSKQDSGEFESLLKKALAVNPDARPEWRLTNLVMQRRARWLLAREDELFVK